MKEPGQAQHILGVRIERNQKTKILRLSETDYIGKVLKRFNMEVHSKPAPTPLPTTLQLSVKGSPSTEEEKKLMVGEMG